MLSVGTVGSQGMLRTQKRYLCRSEGQAGLLGDSDADADIRWGQRHRTASVCMHSKRNTCEQGKGVKTSSLLVKGP